MKCRKVRDNLSAYADGELRLRLRRRVETHLAACENCATELSRLVEITDAAKTSLRRVFSDKAPRSNFRERVMQATEPVRVRRPILVTAGKLAAAAVTIALASGLVVGGVQELRFRGERAAFRQKDAEQRRALVLATADSKRASAQLRKAEARLSKVETQLRLATAIRKKDDRLVEEGPSRRPRSWPPMLSSLQMPGADSLLKNGLF